MTATQTLLFLGAYQTELLDADGALVDDLAEFTTNGFGPDPIYYAIGAQTLGSTVYLTMGDATDSTSAIWAYDGASLTQITSSQDYVYNSPDYNGAGAPAPLSTFNGDLVFSQASLASNTDGQYDTATLALFDPTNSSIVQPIAPNGGYAPHDFVTLNGVLYFEATDSATNSLAIYAYDGASVSEIYNLHPQYFNSVYAANEPAAGTVQGPLVAFNGNLYFGSGQQSVYELTSLASGSNSAASVSGAAQYDFGTLGATELIVADNHLFFLSNNNGIFSLDASNNLTQILGSIGAQSFTPFIYNGLLYFTAYALDSNTNQLTPNLYASSGGAPTLVVADVTLNDPLALGGEVYNSSSTTGLATFDTTGLGTLLTPGDVAGTPLAAAPFAPTHFGVSIATYLANASAYAGRGIRVAIADSLANFTANAAAVNARIAAGQVSSLTRAGYTGQTFSATTISYDAAGNRTSIQYEGETGQPYDSLRYVLSGTIGAGYSYAGFDFFYSGQASGLTEVDFDGGGHLSRELYSFASTAPGTIAGLQIDYVAGEQTDSFYTYNGAGGASFFKATYAYDQVGNYVGATYAFTGQDFNEVICSFTPGVAPTLIETTYSGNFDGQGPADISYFYDATGALTGIQESFTGVTGQAYTSNTVLYNASNVAIASQYTGYSTKPFSTLTYFADSSGVTQEIVREYTSAASSGSINGQPYDFHETITDASSVLLATAYHLDTGGNVYVGVASNVTSPTFGGSGVTANTAELSYAISGGDWTITGGGTNETFTFASLFDTAEITDYGAAFNPGQTDIVSVSTAEFADWSTMLGDAAPSGVGGANTTFTSTTTGDKLTLDGVTVAQLQALTPIQASLDFKFHA